MKILISAGPTREAIDPIRFISNRSSGKMGYALAEAAVNAGHRVTLVSGPVNLPQPDGLEIFLSVESAAQMAEAVKCSFPESQLTIMCAAVADYRPHMAATSKIKKSEGPMILELERTEDILMSLGQNKKNGQILIGFAAETENLAQNALEKMKRKNLDGIAANQAGIPGRGFASDDNAVTLYMKNGSVFDFPLSSKQELARKLIETLTNLYP